ncbi:MAG TPA: amidohydrolase family protein [Ktedonobacterales bacterium]|nr:amidohydrolase family protein [Ktedonobacterales bacterium]
MYTRQDGHEVFVIDGHMHFWDGSPENQANKYGKGFIECFHGYHQLFTPTELLWPLDQFEKYGEARLVRDEFVNGYVDIAILQPTYLKDFFINGFNTTEQDSVVKKAHPDRFILNGSFDPRDGDRGLEYLRRLKGEYDITGVKLYTAEWKGSSKGWKLTSPEAMRFLEECQKLGIVNLHIHKGPTIYPLNKDAFDVSDIDEPASLFTDLRFIVEHAGIPRLEDFCFIAAQDTNIYAGLAVVIPWIHFRPRTFAEMMANLLYWLGPDRLLFGSDYAIWEPKWLIDEFMAFELPQDLKDEYHVDLTPEVKEKIIGLNAARLYGIDTAAHARKIATDDVAQQRAAAAPAAPVQA